MTPAQLQAARQARRWTVETLAARVGVSPRTVEGWEQGRPISGPALKILARLLPTQTKPKRKRKQK